MKLINFFLNIHCVKCVRIRSDSGPHFPTFGPNTERYEVSLRIQSKYRKMRTGITPNTDTFHAVIVTSLKILLKLNYKAEIGNDNEPILSYINKFRNHPNIKLIKSKIRNGKLMQKFLTKSRTAKKRSKMIFQQTF